MNQLRQIESLTGRPFVLLVYGDHQPWSFTQGIYSVAGGTAARQGFKDLFFGSEPVPMAIRHSFTCWRQTGTVVRNRRPSQKPPPASLLPTLASAFVATSYRRPLPADKLPCLREAAGRLGYTCHSLRALDRRSLRARRRRLCSKRHLRRPWPSQLDRLRVFGRWRNPGPFYLVNNDKLSPYPPSLLWSR